MPKSIVHMDLDSFFVSCERTIDKSLIGKPVIVGGYSERGVVSSCSYEARKLGVRSAMPIYQAKKLCPHGIYISGTRGLYSKLSKEVTQIIKENAPVYEKTSIDEFYLDLTGMEKYYDVFDWTITLREKIVNETGLPISFGLSTSRVVSKIAANKAKPNNYLRVYPGEEKAFLAQLSIEELPMVGKKMQAFLRSVGINYVKDIQNMPPKTLESMLGKHGVSLWKKAQGIDSSEVGIHRERKSISTERTFPKDIADKTVLKRFLAMMVEELAYQLRSKNILTKNVAIKIRHSNFKTYTQQKQIDATANDEKLMKEVSSIFNSFYNEPQPLRLIGVRFGNLTSDGIQKRLFDEGEESIDAYKAMDRIKVEFGKKAITKAINLK